MAKVTIDCNGNDHGSCSVMSVDARNVNTLKMKCGANSGCTKDEVTCPAGRAQVCYSFTHLLCYIFTEYIEVKCNTTIDMRNRMRIGWL